MRKTVVINAVGLTPSLLGTHTPRLKAFAESGAAANIGAVIPAVTTAVQSTYLTGTWPNQHGIVGNGWYFREESEIKFWKQSNKLVRGEKLWERARSIDPTCTCANLFWWYNMYSSADWSVTPRPMYPSDGRKIPDVYTHPGELRPWLQAELGEFPLFEFWGPKTSIRSTQWIARASMLLDKRSDPTLTLIYLPHLDYALQRFGPDLPKVAQDLRDLDAVCGQLIDYYKSRKARIIILSEYGITPVSRPIHLNRILRNAGLLAVREELGREMLDPGASEAFAVADHQVAHVYVKNPAKASEIRWLLESMAGIAKVLDDAGKRELKLDHPRAGDLVVLAEPDAWFTYYYWMLDAKMPDYARTVDIHRKPGYDPAELFVDPALKHPALKVAWTLAKKKMGFRTLMEVVPPHGDLVRGSHGLAPRSAADGPLLISDQPALLTAAAIEPTEVFNIILRHLATT